MKIQFQGIDYEVGYPVPNKTGMQIITDHFYASVQEKLYIEKKLVNYLNREGFFKDFFKNIEGDVDEIYFIS
jgi:hypothetical protein